MDAETRANLAHIFDIEAAAAIGDGRVSDGYRLLNHAGELLGQRNVERGEHLAKTQRFLPVVGAS